MKEIGVSVISTSYDGEFHDQNRGFEKLFREKIQLFHKLNKDKAISINAIAVILPTNKNDLIENARRAKEELCFDNYDAHLVSNNKRIKYTEEQLVDTANSFFEYYKFLKENDMPINSFLQQFECPSPQNSLCLFAENCIGHRFGIRANGDFFPCAEG